MDNQEVKFILDTDVDNEMNSKLIEILSICFPDQPIFKEQRYFKEKPKYRWYLETDNEIISHVALHKKELKTETNTITIGGIAEVCVHPENRGKGLVTLLLKYAHDFLIEKGFKFSVLLGDTNVYSSSGYKVIKNEIKYLDHVTKLWKVEKINDVMVKELADDEWPEGIIDIQGPTF